MYSHSTVRRTYASRPRQHPPSPRTSPPPSSPPVDGSGKRKRVLLDCVSLNSPPLKRLNTSGLAPSLKPRPKLSTKSSSTSTSRKSKSVTNKGTTKPLTQLHFVVDSTLRTCPSCSLSYIRGAVDDEVLHKRHCARVQRGLEWGKEEEKEAHKAGIRVIDDYVRIKGHAGDIHGRIIAVPAHVGGKIGAKVFLRHFFFERDLSLVYSSQVYWRPSTMHYRRLNFHLKSSNVPKCIYFYFHLLLVGSI